MWKFNLQEFDCVCLGSLYELTSEPGLCSNEPLVSTVLTGTAQLGHRNDNGDPWALLFQGPSSRDEVASEE